MVCRRKIKKNAELRLEDMYAARHMMLEIGMSEEKKEEKNWSATFFLVGPNFCSSEDLVDQTIY